jgi:cytochrome P450
VLPATQSAMFDEHHVEAPHEFRTNRPPYLDMHFGYGMHTCFGQYINRVQIPGILKPLLKNKLARAGDLQYEGPFPSSLKVRIL